MTEGEQITHFANDLDKLVDRYRAEYDLTFASVVGVLQMKSHLMCMEASGLEIEPKEGDDDGG